MRKEVEGIDDTFDVVRVTNVIVLIFLSGELQNFVAIHPSRPKRNDVEGRGALYNIEALGSKHCTNQMHNRLGYQGIFTRSLR